MITEMTSHPRIPQVASVKSSPKSEYLCDELCNTLGTYAPVVDSCDIALRSLSLEIMSFWLHGFQQEQPYVRKPVDFCYINHVVQSVISETEKNELMRCSVNHEVYLLRKNHMRKKASGHCNDK